MDKIHKYFLQISLLLGGVLLLILFFILGVFVSDLSKVSIPKAIEQVFDAHVADESFPFFESGIESKEFFDSAYARVSSVGKVQATSAIVAHHLLVADKIAEIFETIGSKKTETVILISPNHFSQGASPAQVSKGTWQTPYGNLKTDDLKVNQLLAKSDILKNEEGAFDFEHGISGLTPFILRSFPNADFIPIMIDESIELKDAEELGRVIATTFPKALVIASMDMSHYLPLAPQEYHDSVTEAAIMSADRSVDLEIDSNGVLRTLFAVNEMRNTEAWHGTWKGSALLIDPSADLRDNTSYIMGYFEKGDAEEDKTVSIHFVGDIMLDRGVRIKMDAAGTVKYPWQEMERFFDGSHLTIGNLEGTVNEQASTYTFDPPFRFVFSPASIVELEKYIDVVSLANNHSSDVGSAGELETREWLRKLDIDWFGSYREPVPRFDTTINDQKITLIGYHQFQPNETLLKETIKRASDEGRFVIVMPHWGTEYVTTPSSSQRRLAQLMIDSGADLIIGGHPHVPQGIEIIDNIPVIYSLGNFIFDQQIPETWPAITIGLTLTKNRANLSLIPVFTKGSQPIPLNNKDSQELFRRIADASDEELRIQILNGLIEHQYE